MRKIQYAKGFFFFFLGLVLFVISSSRIKEDRKILSARYALNIINVPPVAIRLIAGEFNGLISDFILLQIGSFIGCGRKIESEEWQNVRLGFNQVLELDPYYEQTYLMAQSSMAWDARMPEEAIQMLNIARQGRVWDFRPGFYVGFDYYYFLNDYDNASMIFLETAKIQNAPVLLGLLGSRFSAREGKTQASLIVLTNMLKQPDITEANAKEINNRIIALKGVLVIEEAIRTYSERFGFKPASLEKLVDTGILKQLPFNPYLTSYTYDPNLNEVRFDDVKDLIK